jgi:CubicO group peptidase (beta-lactamase class C family)
MMKKILSLLFTIFGLYLSVAQSESYGVSLDKLVSLYNSEKYDEIYQNFSPQMKGAITLKENKDFFLETSKEFGKIESTEFVSQKSKNEGFALYKGKADKGFVNILFALNKNNEIDGIDITPFIEKKTAANQLSEIPEDYKKILFDYSKTFPDQTQISVAVIKNGKTSFYGIIRKNDTLNTIDNHQKLFEIGSVTKLFTATILAQLVLEKKLELEDNVNRFYNFPFKNDIKLSFGMLANHSSGLYRIPKNLEENIEENNPYKNYAADKLEDYLQNSLILENASGKNYGYSNLAFGLLGFTMAKEEKTTFQKLLQKRIFDKFEMNNSFTNVTSAEKSGKLIKGLDKDGKETSQWDFDALSGCGSAVSSVQDLAKFSLAQFNSSNKDLQLTQIPTFTKDQKTKIGLAWHIYKDDSQGKLLWHNGGTGGYSSSLLLNPKTKNGVVVLSNVAPGNLDQDNIEKIAFDILKVLDVRK